MNEPTDEKNGVGSGVGGMGRGASDHKVVVGDAAAGALATDAEENGGVVGVVEEGLELVVALGEGAAILRGEVVEALGEPEGLLRDVVGIGGVGQGVPVGAGER